MFLKLVKGFSWNQATFLSFVFGLGSFFVFYFLEIIFGDTLKNVLDAEYQAEMYLNINIILYLGLFFIFLSSSIVNIFTLRKYVFEPKFVSNLFSLIYTYIILFFISWISILIVYSDFYGALTLTDQVNLIINCYCFISIYILPNPFYFWGLGFIIYHSVLIIFIKKWFFKRSK